MNQRYRHRFEALRSRNEGAFVPFTVLGDPDPETSLAVLEAFVAGGADMLELGIPFSDPVADGPTIQAADLRALSGGTTPDVAIEILAEFRRRHPDIPIGLLLYANLVQRPGPHQFCERLARAGVDSILVADLPLEESGPFRSASEAAGIGMVALVTHLTCPDRLSKLIDLGGPFLYVVSRAGVTGRDRSLSNQSVPVLKRIRRLGGIPTLLGFGIGKPSHVRAAISAGATGAISGSAVVEIIAGQSSSIGVARNRQAPLLAELRQFVSAMKGATLK